MHRLSVLFALLAIFSCIAQTQQEFLPGDDCPGCLMPCTTEHCIDRTSLIKAYTTSYNEYRITTLLNGIHGYFQTTVYYDKYKRVYSARINLEYWPYKTICKILSQTPTISNDPNNKTILGVRYNIFLAFNVHLKPEFVDNDLQYILIEKLAQAQYEIVNSNNNNNTCHYTLENLKKIYRLGDAIKNAYITGFTGTDIFKSPGSSYHCNIEKKTWLEIDLKEVFAFNYINFQLYDRDTRTYTYNLTVSLDNRIWRDIAVSKTGKSVQDLPLPGFTNIRYIKMQGYNTVNNYLHLYYFRIELK